jgi:LysR family hydrogen peroxide-inducible transcriptional activator
VDRLAVSTEVRRSELHVRPLAAPVPKRTRALVWRKRSSLRTALRQVATTIRGAYPKP